MADDENSAPNTSAGDTAFEARKLLRAARSGTLATAADGGQPFASLVTPACAPDFSPLLLLSNLSEHTRHLRAEPRCSLLVCGAAEGANPQTAPRLTVTGIAEPADDAALKSRFLAVHPYASLYADFGDFHLWRIKPMGALFVGGFARAVRLKQTELAPDAASVKAVAAAETGIIGHCNQDHPDALAAIAGEAGAWRMVTADVDGTDLALDERVARFNWSAPIADANGARVELVRMAREARTRGAR
jgi:heme iron utilization protein